MTSSHSIRTSLPDLMRLITRPAKPSIKGASYALSLTTTCPTTGSESDGIDASKVTVNPVTSVTYG